MNWGRGERGWFLTDAYGRGWRLTLPTSRGTPSSAGAARAVAVLTGLNEGAFAPWGTAGPHVAASLLAICEAVGERQLVREHRDSKRGDPGWRGRLDRVRRLLVREAESGWLQCEPIAIGGGAVVLDDAPDTLREPPVPIPEATTWFELRVVDEIGDPIPGVDVAFGVGATRRIVPTDGGGVARLEDSSIGFLSANVANIAQLRQQLAPRWTSPRVAKFPKGPDVRATELERATESLSLEAEKQSTLAITPLFRCNELSGVHFAFERSFVLESALDTLSIMAASILEDENRRAMIFGHTDTAGSEALNKELSERRAKVILAVLTHDTDAWEQLWTGSDDGPNFKERWGVKEAQHLPGRARLPTGRPASLM